MTDHAADKQLAARFLAELAAAGTTEIAAVLRRYCAPDVAWEIFHPFNSMSGIDAVAEQFWVPLKTAFPDYEHRLNVVIGGEYAGRDWVSTLGHVMGSFEQPWLGIPPTRGLAFLRIGMNLTVEGGRISSAHVLLDIIDVMRQAGQYPFRAMPGSPEQWPAPPVTAATPPGHYDAETGATTFAVTMAMQGGLYSGEHSEHWHKNMNWYGPAGIGSTRGARGFYDYHCALWNQAFPDDHPYDGESGGPHYIRVGDGHFSVTSGWPSLHATHAGGGLFGMVPSGRHVHMRVADWYRTDARNRLIDNWVLIDVPHILIQCGYDVLDDMRYLIDPALPRHDDVERALLASGLWSGPAA